MDANNSSILRRIRRRYLIALSLIAILVSTSGGMLQVLLSQQEDDGSLINIAGKQRMLSQKIALHSTKLLHPKDFLDVESELTMLLAATNEMLDNHIYLLDGSNLEARSKKMSVAIYEMYFGGVPTLDSRIREYIQTAQSLHSHISNERNKAQDQLWYPSEHTNKLLKDLNAVVKQFEIEANERTSSVHTIEVFLWVATLILLGLEIIFIFRPLEKQVGHYLKRANDAKTVAEEAQHKAELASLAKSQFLANMSHELRTPLNGITGMIQLASDEENEKSRFNYLMQAKSSSQHLLELINDILDISKIEAAQLKINNEPFLLNRIIDECLAPAAIQAQKAGIDFRYTPNLDIPNRVIGDSLRIKQILNNLLSNAIKFTKKGYVECSVSLVDKYLDNVTIKVNIQDTGVGIASEKLNHIFDSFTQEDNSTTREFGGTGLGLNISKQLVELMNGKIEVISKKGEGSEFSFTVPLLLDKSKHTEKKLPNSALKVVVLDDLDSSLVVISEYLTRYGLNPICFHQGKRALSYLEQYSSDIALIITDLHMPGMDGIEFARQYYELLGEYKKDIILISAAADSYNFTAEERNLFKTIVQKPADEDSFIQFISEFVTRVPVTKSLNLLVAEDNSVSSIVIDKYLQKLGHTITMVENGKQAVDAVSKDPFDAIILDINMPVMNGYDAAKIMRHDLQVDLPIIALTANAFEEDIKDAHAAGMDYHLSKPIEFEKLKQLLEKIAMETEQKAL